MPEFSANSPSAIITKAKRGSKPGRFDKKKLDASTRQSFCEWLDEHRSEVGGMRSPQDWLWIISEEVNDDQLRFACLVEYIREFPALEELVLEMRKVPKRLSIGHHQLKLASSASSFLTWIFLKSPDGEQHKQAVRKLLMKLSKLVSPLPLDELLRHPIEKRKAGYETKSGLKCAFGHDGILQFETELPKPGLAVEFDESPQCWVGRAIKCSDFEMEIKRWSPEDENYCTPPKSLWSGSETTGEFVALVIPRRFLRLKHAYNEIADLLGAKDNLQKCCFTVRCSRGSPLVVIPEECTNAATVTEDADSEDWINLPTVTEAEAPKERMSFVSVPGDDDLVFFAAKNVGIALNALWIAIQNTELAQQSAKESSLANWGRNELVHALNVLSSWRVSEGRTREQWGALSLELESLRMGSSPRKLIRGKRIDEHATKFPSDRMLTVEKHVKDAFPDLVKQIFPRLDFEKYEPVNRWREKAFSRPPPPQRKKWLKGIGTTASIFLSDVKSGTSGMRDVGWL
jgi:hypothetical protein